MPSAATSARALVPPVPAVAWWLFVLCAMVAAIVVVGGATRLTDSGLSIVRWNLAQGVLPPMSQTAWAARFAEYQATPQYRLLNPDMTLEGFRGIFWWEWVHRQMGRLVGLVFFVPFVWFLLRGELRGRWAAAALGMGLLGGAQGALGWWMVRSGLVGEMVAVAPIRLAAHMGLAMTIFVLGLWLALNARLGQARLGQRDKARRVESRVWLIGAALGAQILLGALLAGMDGGRFFNTWPLMDGALAPAGLFSQGIASLWRDPLTVQFAHRTLALVLLALVLWDCWRARLGSRAVASRAVALLASMAAQAALGIATLLAEATLGLALAHQALALVVVLLWVLRARVSQRGGQRVSQPTSDRGALGRR